MVRVGVMVKKRKFRVDKFNGQNYHLWKMQMEDYLYQNNIFLPLGGIEKKPTIEGKICNYLTQAFSDLAWLMQDSRECYPIFIASKSASQSTSINYKGLG
jgi:hypothetical protein